jgi:hypothetical protein
MTENTGGTMTLTDFLLARITEDEAWARAASEGDGYQNWDTPSTGVVQLAGGDLDGLVPTSRAAAEHIVRHDPARVLADCDAKRRIVMAPQPDSGTDFSGGVCTAFAWVHKILALPYAGHPDYRDKWRP